MNSLTFIRRLFETEEQYNDALYVLSARRTSKPKFVILYGTGANGKTLLMQLHCNTFKNSYRLKLDTFPESVVYILEQNMFLAESNVLISSIEIDADVYQIQFPKVFDHESRDTSLGDYIKDSNVIRQYKSLIGF